MFAFWKKKEDDAATSEDQWQEAMQKDLEREQGTRAERRAKKLEDQSHVLAALKQLLPPDVLAKLSVDISLAESAIQANQPVPASLMAKLNDALKTQELANLQKGIGGGILCCAAASEAWLGTSMKHGLDAIAFARPVGRTLLGSMMA